MAGRVDDRASGRRSALTALTLLVAARLPTVDEQRVRLTRRLSQAAASGAGFTLVELLVTIVILGVLSVIVVFAVNGLSLQGQTSACAADRSALTAAMEAHRARVGMYATEAQLVAAGQLRRPSTLHDVTLVGDDYAVTGVGACADESSGVEAAGVDPVAAVEEPSTTSEPAPTTTTTAPPTTTTQPAKLKALKLAAVCTDPDHWPGERAWTIKNPNAVAVDFTLDAVNAHESPDHEIAALAPSGTTTWLLPAADHGTNTAALTALGKETSVKNNKTRC